MPQDALAERGIVEILLRIGQNLLSVLKMENELKKLICLRDSFQYINKLNKSLQGLGEKNISKTNKNKEINNLEHFPWLVRLEREEGNK